MKRFLALFLALVMVFGMVPALGTVAKAETTVTAKPFYGLTWSPVEMSLFGNLEDAPVLNVSSSDGVVSMEGSDNFAAKAASLKTTLDALPEGMRYIRIQFPSNALKVAEHVVYADEGVAQLKALVTELIEEYYKIGGQLDGILTDTEYTAMGSWYIYSDTYGGYYEPSAEKIEANGYNRNIFNDIVNHPNYATDIRPLLEERGFVFYDDVGGNKSEIWSMFPPQIWGNFSAAERTKFNTYYANCYSIWNKVMNNRIAAYMTEAIYEPMVARYPDAAVSDYKVADTATWENYMSESGSVGNYSGNSDKIGNVSDMNMYNSGPNSGFFTEDGTYLYNNVLSHNAAVYDDDAYGSLMFSVNRFKSIYSATDTKKLSVWIAEYDYSGRANSTMNSPYYTEFMYHVGMLDPQPFKVYMYTGNSKFSGTEGAIAYNARMEVISQILDELTRVAGYSDRKPIETPQSWNDGFLLSGMYANGRNIWRLTPDTTDGKTLADFKVAGTTNPTFSINGNTITFPGGAVLSNATIDTVGSCGYWIETAANVQPIITREDNRYANNPSFGEDFEDFASGDVFNSPNTVPMQVWENSTAMISSTVSLTGTASKSFTIPAAVVSSTYQSWEMKFTVPYSKKTEDKITTEATLTETAEMVFLTYGTDGGIKVVNKQVYYDSNGSYVLLDGVTLTPGSTYRVRRVVDLGTSTCDYTIHTPAGALVAEVKDVPMKAVSGTVTTLGASVSNFQKITTVTDADGNVTSTTTTDATLSITAASANIPLYVEESNGSKVLALTGTATLDNVKLPKNITAGDSYAKKQAWELSFTLSEALTTGSATFFNGMVKLENGKIYYNANGSYVELADIAAGTKYTINVNNNFTANTATYTLSADGAEVAQAADIAVAAVTLPVSTISMAATGLTAKVLVDDYKLYPTGLEYTIKCYDADTGVIQSATEQLTNENVAYRLSWMNATSSDAKGKIYVDRHDGSDPEELKTIDMQSGWDGVETGVLENTTGELTVYLHICEKANTTLVGAVEAGCTTEGYTGDLVCNDCGEIYEQGSVIAGGNHKVVTVPRTPATCTTPGKTEGKYCSVCNEVLVAQEDVPATGHTENIIAAAVPATCTTTGKTALIRCATCGITLQAREDIPALGHAGGDPVQENVVEGSCTVAGSYDLVVYCTREGCGAEVSREQIVDEALGHTEETVAGYAATCTATGLTDGKVCSVCGEVLVEQTEIPVTDHTAAAAVKENVTATSYESVVECSVCGEELSRETVYSSTVTLWGTAATIDADDLTEDIPEALYWINGAEGEAPVAATAEDDWNYSFTVVDGVAVVTLRNAAYSGTATFLSATFDGKLKLVYEGTNNIVVPYSSSAYRYFINYSGYTRYDGKLYIEGAEDAVLNVTGGDNSCSMLSVGNRAALIIDGGTLDIRKTNAGGVNAVIGAGYSDVTFKNCTLYVKLDDGVGGKHPAITVGGNTGTLEIENANVTVETNAHTGICVGVFQSNMKGVLYAAAMTISGNSNVKVINSIASTTDYAYSGVGIYASTLTVNGGNLEVDATKQAVYLATTDAIPDLSEYSGDYEIYTEEGGEAATAYTATPYFKVKYLCPHTTTTTTETVVEATCTAAGSRTVTVTCECGEVISEEITEIPMIPHTEEVVPGKAATCLETGLTDGKICTVCGEVLIAQEEIPLGDHTAAAPVKENVVEATDTEDGSYELVVYCTLCGEEISREPIVVPAESDDATDPVEPGAALDTSYVLYMADHSGTALTAYTLTNYDTPVYSKNTTFTTGYFTANDYTNKTNADSYVTQRAGTEDDWNAKLIWHTGDEGPTLYLDGFEIDTYSETVSDWLQRGTGTAKFFHCALSTGSTAPLKIVLTGEDSYIQNYNGIHYQNKLTIESDGDTKLEMFTRNSGIIPTNDVANLYDPTGTYNDVIGYSLTLNANLDICTYSATSSKTDSLVTDGTYAVEDWNFGIVSTREADLIINGGNISIKAAGPTGTANLTGPFGMKAKVSGNIIVNGGNLTVEAGLRGIQVWPGYEMQINGGTVAAGISSSGYFALYESSAAASPGTSAATVPVLPADGSYTLWQGDSADTATEVTALSGGPKYFKVEFAPECEHIEEVVPGKAATCTEVGYTEGKICTVCGERTVLRKEIAALGHTVVILPEQELTCTQDGKTEGSKCSVCGEILVAQVVTPATGHTYDDVTDIDCNTCAAVRPTIEVNGNTVTVHLNDLVSAKTHTFYVEGKEIADINDWAELKATGTLKTYTAYEFILAKAGDYVLRLEYVDGEGVRDVTSYTATIESTDDTSAPACKPEFVVNDNLVTVNANGATNMKVHAFYVEGKEVADINYWSALTAADPNFKTYSKSIIPLTKVGKYILRAEYNDTTGAKMSESFEINVDCVPVSLTVANKKVTVNVDGAANVKVFAFFVEDGESVSNIYDWNELKTVDPEFKTYIRDTFVLPEVGRYVLRVQYVDSQGVSRAVSYMADTSLIVPEAVVSGDWIKITTNGLTIKKVHVFNIEGQDIADINDWSELRAEAISYQAYTKIPFILKTNGTYVMRMEFIDNSGAVCTASQLVTIAN